MVLQCSLFTVHLSPFTGFSHLTYPLNIRYYNYEIVFIGGLVAQLHIVNSNEGLISWLYSWLQRMIVISGNY